MEMMQKNKPIWFYSYSNICICISKIKFWITNDNDDIFSSSCLIPWLIHSSQLNVSLNYFQIDIRCIISSFSEQCQHCCDPNNAIFLLHVTCSRFDFKNWMKLYLLGRLDVRKKTLPSVTRCWRSSLTGCWRCPPTSLCPSSVFEWSRSYVVSSPERPQCQGGSRGQQHCKVSKQSSLYFSHRLG